jgi:hypothetical protein
MEPQSREHAERRGAIDWSVRTKSIEAVVLRQGDSEGEEIFDYLFIVIPSIFCNERVAARIVIMQAGPERGDAPLEIRSKIWIERRGVARWSFRSGAWTCWRRSRPTAR